MAKKRFIEADCWSATVLRTVGILGMVLVFGLAVVGCDNGSTDNGADQTENNEAIYSTIGQVFKVYKSSEIARFATGQQVTINGKSYTFEGSLVEYSTVSRELLDYVEALESNNALMHQPYDSVAFDPDHKYVEMGLYLNNTTGKYDIVELRVFYGDFLDTFNTSYWYAKSVAFTSDFSQEYYSGRITNFSFAKNNGEQVLGDNQQTGPQEFENTLFIGTATEGVYAGTHFYIGNTRTSSDTPSYIYTLPGWHLHLGSDWDNTLDWKTNIDYMLLTYKIKKNGQDVLYQNLPDYSGTGDRNNRMQHFVFSLGLTQEQTQDYNNDTGIQKNFFGIIPDGYSSGNLAGGILYHWTWDSVDKTNELGEILVQKGYHLTYTSPENTAAMSWYGTRVEMNTISSPRYYSVEYFDGNGNCWWKNYSEDSEQTTFGHTVKLPVPEPSTTAADYFGRPGSSLGDEYYEIFTSALEIGNYEFTTSFSEGKGVWTDSFQWAYYPATKRLAVHLCRTQDTGFTSYTIYDVAESDLAYGE
jgi:hypothetical protein